MIKRVLFLVVFSFLFFSCGLNNFNDGFVCVSLSENSVKSICREAGVSTENLSVKCVLKQEGYEDIEQTSVVVDNKAKIEFTDIPINSEITISATVNFNKALDNKYIEKYEGISEKYTVVEGENKISIKLSPIYKEGNASISVQEKDSEILINAYCISSGEEKTFEDESELYIKDFENIRIEAKLRNGNIKEGEKIIFKVNGINCETEETGKLIISKTDESLKYNNIIVVKFLNEENKLICSNSISFKLIEK